MEINKLTGGFRFAHQSSGQRLFIVNPPTSYICNPATGHIVGHSKYVFNSLQSTAPGGTTARAIHAARSGIGWGHIPVHGERCLHRLDSS